MSVLLLVFQYQVQIGVDATVDHLKDALYQRTRVHPANVNIAFLTSHLLFYILCCYNHYRGRGLNLRPPTWQSGTQPLDHRTVAHPISIDSYSRFDACKIEIHSFRIFL